MIFCVNTNWWKTNHKECFMKNEMFPCDDVIDELLKNYQKPEDLLGEGGLLKMLTKRLTEGALSGEITNHFGYEKNMQGARENGNARNGPLFPTVNRPNPGRQWLETSRNIAPKRPWVAWRNYWSGHPRLQGHQIKTNTKTRFFSTLSGLFCR